MHIQDLRVFSEVAQLRQATSKLMLKDSSSQADDWNSWISGSPQDGSGAACVDGSSLFFFLDSIIQSEVSSSLRGPVVTLPGTNQDRLLSSKPLRPCLQSSPVPCHALPPAPDPHHHTIVSERGTRKPLAVSADLHRKDLHLWGQDFVHRILAGVGGGFVHFLLFQMIS